MAVRTKGKILVGFVAMPYQNWQTLRIQELMAEISKSLSSAKIKLVVGHTQLTTHLLLTRNLRRLVARSDFVVCVTEGRNLNVSFEAGLAVGLGKPLLLVLLPETSSMPATFNGHYWLELEGNDGDRERLTETLETFVAGIRDPRPSADARVFLCHRSLDKPVVGALASRLEGAGYDVWYDSWKIRPGDSIPTMISNGLERSTHFIICLSKNTAGSRWVGKELNSAMAIALQRGKPKVIPVFLDTEGQRAMPTLLREVRGVTLYGRDVKEAYKELVLGLRDS